MQNNDYPMHSGELWQALKIWRNGSQLVLVNLKIGDLNALCHGEACKTYLVPQTKHPG